MSDNSIKKIKIGNSEYDLTASNGIYYVEGTGSTAGTWLGSHDDITSYYPGLMIAYKIGIAGASATTLNINNLGAVTVVKNATTAISTNFAVNSVIFLVYTVDSGTAYWKAHDYDANTKNTTGTSEKASTKLYITGATSQTSSGTTTYSNKKVYIGTDNCLYSNDNKVVTQADTATTSAAGIMSAADKTKLDGIATGANAYTHPTTSGNKHIPSGGSSGQILRWSADGTATWGADNNTTYSTATQSAAGLMSAADKTKLDGIATGANNYTYTLPTASSSTLGGVKTGSNITNSSGTISITKDNVTAALGYTPPTTNTTYSNMTAATSSAAGKAGLVPAPAAGKQASFLRGDGTWVVPTNTTYSTATQSAAGLMSAADKTKLDGLSGEDNVIVYTITGDCSPGSTVTINSDFSTIKSQVDAGKTVVLKGTKNLYGGNVNYISGYANSDMIVFSATLYYEITSYLAMSSDGTITIANNAWEYEEVPTDQWDRTNFWTTEGNVWWEKKGSDMRYYVNIKTKKNLNCWNSYVIATNVPYTPWYDTSGDINDCGCLWASNGTLYFYPWVSVHTVASGNTYTLPANSWITGNLKYIQPEGVAI